MPEELIKKINEEEELDPNAFSVVEVEWTDHTVTHSEDGTWLELKEGLESSGVITVTEVGYLIKQTDEEIILANCITPDGGCKGLTAIIPSCVKSWTILREGE